jgi:hypothetical protein
MVARCRSPRHFPYRQTIKCTKVLNMPVSSQLALMPPDIANPLPLADQLCKMILMLMFTDAPVAPSKRKRSVMSR